jgi:hypothetical protein
MKRNKTKQNETKQNETKKLNPVRDDISVAMGFNPWGK